LSYRHTTNARSIGFALPRGNATFAAENLIETIPSEAYFPADEGVQMKTFLIILALAALGYGAYYFMMQVRDKTEQRQGDWKTEKKLESVLGNEGTK